MVLELSGGMGRGLAPPPGTVPEVGERLCWTTLSDAFMPAGNFPAAEETPWTHGGPPAAAAAEPAPMPGAAESGNGDPAEDWS